MDIFLSIAAILSMIATAATAYIVCRHAELKALNRHYFSVYKTDRGYIW